jgi:cell wall-associated NlpC family hydrolase
MSYFFAGINIWRDADIDRSTALKQITLSEAQKGDLLFYRGHVAVYLGDEKFIHSCGSHGVCYGDFETSPHMKNNIVAIGTVK